MTGDSMMETLDLAQKLERVKPWPANQDRLRGLPPLSDDEQLERYLESLSITNIGGLIANTYYNGILLGASELLSRGLYARFVREIETRRIYSQAERDKARR